MDPYGDSLDPYGNWTSLTGSTGDPNDPYDDELGPPIIPALYDPANPGNPPFDRYDYIDVGKCGGVIPPSGDMFSLPVDTTIMGILEEAMSFLINNPDMRDCLDQFPGLRDCILKAWKESEFRLFRHKDDYDYGEANPYVTPAIFALGALLFYDTKKARAALIQTLLHELVHLCGAGELESEFIENLCASSPYSDSKPDLEMDWRFEMVRDFPPPKNWPYKEPPPQTNRLRRPWPYYEKAPDGDTGWFVGKFIWYNCKTGEVWTRKADGSPGKLIGKMLHPDRSINPPYGWSDAQCP